MYSIKKNIEKLKPKLSQKAIVLTREEKDDIDLQINRLIKEGGLPAVLELFPQELKIRWKSLFSREFQAVLKYSFKPLPKVIRINTLKISREFFLKIANKYNWKLRSLKISPIAFTVLSEGNKNIDDAPEYKRGFFYIQQLASMLPVFTLNPKPGEKILDIGAAPGSKTTQIAQLMKNEGQILANDISEERIEILKENCRRLGVKIAKFYLGDGSLLGNKYPKTFDGVLIDGPCSCEGTIRYKPHKLIEWNFSQLRRLAKIQKRLLESGFKALKTGGILVYSTCTYGPEENEAVVDYLLKKYRTANIIPVKFKSLKTRFGRLRWKNLKFDRRLVKAVRILPQDIDSTGFFICKILKKEVKSLG